MYNTASENNCQSHDAGITSKSCEKSSGRQDRINNPAGIADAFSRAKMISYTEETDRYYPALLDVLKKIPEWNDAWWLMRYQLTTMLEALDCQVWRSCHFKASEKEAEPAARAGSRFAFHGGYGRMKVRSFPPVGPESKENASMKKVLKIVGRILLALVLVVAAALVVLTVAEYRPADRETVIADHAVQGGLPADRPLTLISWNVGYGALGDNADFFMDGGKGVYTADRERVAQNLAGIRETLTGLDADLILLQEVDAASDRSYRTDEREALRGVLPDASAAFATNFNSLYVPYPLPPIGHVESGIYTLSRADIREAERISLPNPFSWPLRVANLKRCLLVSRIPVEGSERELVLVNFHLEAYDSGEGKEAQTRMLRTLLEEEYAKGNYVIAGGDFNQQLESLDTSAYPVFEGMWMPGLLSADAFGEHYSLRMDASVPTCRSLDRPYAGESDEGFQFYVIDGFIVSDNLQVESLETLNEGFVWTDHNPVRLQVSLR